MDMDQDGIQELFIVYTYAYEHPQLESGVGYYLYTDTFTLKNEVPTLVEERNIGTYSDSSEFILLLGSNEYTRDKLFISTVFAEGKRYIIFEYRGMHDCFSEYENNAFWALTYENGEVDFAFVVSESNRAFIGYSYENGEMISTELLIVPGYTGDEEVYGTMNEGLAAFFGRYGITVNYLDRETSILDDDAVENRIFSFSNDCVAEDSSTGGHTFNLDVIDYTNLREFILFAGYDYGDL
jgi:hypothetical protein